MLSGVRNTSNMQVAPNGGSMGFSLLAEPGPISLSCGAHPWMKGKPGAVVDLGQIKIKGK
jgi:hypothetical protein